MADEGDIAAAMQQAEIDAALARHAARPRDEGGRVWCEDCGDLIPHQRRAHGFCTCVACQQAREAKAKHKGKRRC